MTTGVLAWMPWRRPVGMWAQVPGLASWRSSPGVPRTASPFPQPVGFSIQRRKHGPHRWRTRRR
jgi:hypothetical protein